MTKYIYLGKEETTLRVGREKITVQPGESFESTVSLSNIKHKSVKIFDDKTVDILTKKIKSHEDKIATMEARKVGLKETAKAQYEERLLAIDTQFEGNLVAYNALVVGEKKNLSYFKKTTKVEKKESKEVKSPVMDDEPKKDKKK